MPVFTVPIHEVNHCHGPGRGHPCLPGEGSSGVQMDTQMVTGADARMVLGASATVEDLTDLAHAFTGPETPWFGVEIKEATGDLLETRDGHAIKFVFAGEGAIGEFGLVKKWSEGLRGELGLVWVEPGKRKKGLSRPILRDMVKGFEQAGVSRIELTAVDIGSYAWLRYGWTPKLNVEGFDAYRAKQVTKSLRDRLAGLKNIGPNVRQYIKTAIDEIEAGNGKAAWRIADLRDGKRNLGKEMLVDVTWRGEIDLRDPEARARLDHYMKG